MRYGDRMHQQGELVEEALADEPSDRGPQPDIPMSPSASALSARSCSATLASSGPESTVVLCQAGSNAVWERTYFGMPLMCEAKGTSSAWVGQYSDHSPYRCGP